MAAVGFTKLIGEVATLQKKLEHAVSEPRRFGLALGGLDAGGEKLHDGLEY